MPIPFSVQEGSFAAKVADFPLHTIAEAMRVAMSLSRDFRRAFWIMRGDEIVAVVRANTDA